MKVLDLECGNGHTFEGWFGSREDFSAQNTQGLVECPACGNAQIVKKLSAPRLNFGAVQPQASQSVSTPASSGALSAEPSATTAWMEAAKAVLANTDDVGNQFAQEARRIHYGESEARGIRGISTPDEAMELLDEGIAVMPYLLPEALKGSLQ